MLLTMLLWNNSSRGLRVALHTIASNTWNHLFISDDNIIGVFVDRFIGMVCLSFQLAQCSVVGSFDVDSQAGA